MKKLPIGIQSIGDILTEGYVYVDKTQFALQMIKSGKHYFLSRPRRFGKSLFVSTLKEIFKGHKELFKGCAIYESDYDWQPHPVLHFDFGKIANKSPEALDIGLQEAIEDLAQLHGVNVQGASYQSRLNRLLVALAKKGSAAVLIDEYDKPIIDNLHQVEVAEENRKLLRAFFGTLKSLEEHIRFTFITGISKFSQVSLFSGANHLKDLTMLPQYAGMMGYTEEELVQYFAAHLQAITEERNAQGQPVTKQDVLAEIKGWYNGYRFSKAATQVYNPFSTLNFLDEKEARSYWYDSGTPSFLIEQVRKHPQVAAPLAGTIAEESTLMSISSLEEIDLKALMFQTGYLTIQAYQPGDEDVEESYTLDFPNREVRRAFFSSLLKEFAKVDPRPVSRAAKQLRADLAAYQLEAFVNALNVHLAKIPYHASSKAQEGFYQAIFLTYLELSGIRAQAEVVTNKGRIDVMCELEEAIYIFELKVDQPASIAMNQAQVREYSKRYTQAGKQILVMGISFSSKTRDIAQWLGELQSAAGKMLRTFVPGQGQASGVSLEGKR
ncbi:MAG: AAA family ATPase [Roseivirga sp.]